MKLRRSSLGAAVLAAALLLVGCTGAPSANRAATADAAAEGFPVTFEHAYGETELKAKPERVVTLGWMTQDIVSSLGVMPVGITENWGGDDSGYTEWYRNYVERELDAELPQLVPWGEDGVDYEAILALKPDVILAPYSGFTEVEYKRLSEIAPTVPHAKRAWSAGTWKDLTRLVGKALGENEQAETLIGTVSGALADEVAKYPNLAGTSFVYSLTGSEGMTELALYISEDPRVTFLREMGLVDSPSLTGATDDVEDDLWYGGVSLEQLDTIDTDLVVAWSFTPEETRQTLANPIVSRWQPFADGHYYIIDDIPLASASSSPTVLSIPWLIQRGYVADLSSAVDGTPVVRQAQ